MEINELKKKLNYLIKQREKCEKVIFNRDVILEGVYREFYKVCGRKNCWCYQGEKKHGPYHKIEVIREGKQKVYIIPKSKVPEVIELYNNRKEFLEAESKIKSINEEIYEVIKEIKKLKEKRADKRWLK
jgi:hypothetical protein